LLIKAKGDVMNGTTRILIADDEPAALEVFTTILGRAGYEIWEASNGQQCLQMTRERRPDLVLLDVVLPDLNGFEVCRQIKAEAALSDIFVVLVSGKAVGAADKVSGAESGADDYILKPVNPDEFLARIRTIARLRDTTIALRTREKHYQRLINILPDAIGVITPQGRLMMVNQQAVEILGYADAEELLAKNAFDLVAAEEHERMQADIATTLGSGVRRNAEYTMLRKNGARFPAEFNAVASTDADNQSRGIIIVARDITARRQAETRIRELLLLLDQAHDAIIVLDLEGHVQYFNQGAERLLGWSADEIRGHRITERYLPDASAFAAAREKLLKTGEWDGESQAVTKARKPIFLHSRWTLVRGHHGQSPQVVCICTDITGRKQTEEALRQSQERYRTLAESSPDAIFILDRELVIQYVNPVAMQWLGRMGGELLGHSVAEFFPPEIARQQQKVVQRVFETGESARLERGHPFCGTVKWIETRLVPLRNPRGKILSVMGIARDLTEQKQTAEALREREELSQKIISTAMEGFFMLDLEGKIVDVNEAYCRMSGYSRQELLTKHVSDLSLSESSAELVNQHVRRIAQSGSDRFETRHRGKDGRIIELEAVTTFLKLREQYVFAFMRDITERKRAEQLLQASQERFQQLAENIREVFWITNPAKSEMIYISPGYEHVWGRTCASLYAAPMSWVESIHPDDRERIREAALSRQVSGQYDEVYRIVRTDGAHRWIHDRAFPIRDDSGTVHRIVGIAEDITQQKKTEDSLRETEARYRSIFENATEGIFRSTLEGRILIANPALARMFGYQSPGELMSTVGDVGRQLYVLPKRREEMINLLLEQSSIQGFEEENYRRDGSIIWVSLNAHVVKDARGAVQYIEGTIQEISARKQAEGKLVVLAHAIESTAEMICVTDMEDKFTFVNHAFLRGYGYALGELLGKTPDILLSPNNPPSMMSEILKQSRLEGWRGEVLDRRKDGTEFPVFLSTSKIIDPSGRAIGLIGVAQDITERKRAEEQIRLLAYAVQSARDLIWITDSENRFTFVNQSFIEAYGYSREEILGRSRDILVSSKNPATLYENISRETTDGSWRGELLNRRKDGTEFPVSLSTSEIRNSEGKVIGVIGVARDITERKQAEEVLHRFPLRIIEVQEAERLRVARELHDGVNQIIASAKMRLRKVEDSLILQNPAAREILARCSQLLVQALEENRRIAHNLRPSDLDEFGLATASRNFCRALQSRTRLAVKCHITRIDQRLSPTVELNLFRIMQEAFNNIEKHARARKAQLRITVRDDFIVMRIRDDGRGFDLQRGKVSKRKWGGIGLTNMRERAESLGGTCAVESLPRRGTTITVRVPREKSI
jgi:PAS domain S-box-containing protein